MFTVLKYSFFILIQIQIYLLLYNVLHKSDPQYGNLVSISTSRFIAIIVSIPCMLSLKSTFKHFIVLKVWQLSSWEDVIFISESAIFFIFGYANRSLITKKQ